GALDDDLPDVDLGLDERALADDERVVGEDLAAKAAVDANGALERELALERGAASEQRGDLAESRLLRCGGCHGGGTLARDPTPDRPRGPRRSGRRSWRYRRT